MDWIVYDATISGWEKEHRGGIDPRAWFRKSSRPYTGVALRLWPRLGKEAAFTSVNVDRLPPHLAKRCSKLDRNAAIPEWEKRDSFPILLATSSGRPSNELADPYEMRDEFFGLSCDLDQLTDFARKWGRWDSNNLAISQSERIGVLDKKETPCIFPHWIQHEQAKFRNALCAAQEQQKQWLSHPERTILIVQRSQKPYFFVTADSLTTLESCRGAIAATITLDHLSRSQFRTCSRDKCKRPFKLESEHDRKYCTRRCAHAEAQRAYRESAKPEKARKDRRAR